MMFKAIFAIAFVVAAVSGHGGPGGPMGGPGGPFKELEKGLTEEQKTQLQAIFKNDAATKQQMQDSLKSFFDGVGGDASTKFNEMQSKMETMKSEMETKINEAIASLSDGAKSLATQMKTIHDNMSLTPAQERDQIKALFEGASDEIKKELKSAKGQFMQGMMGPGGPGPMGGPHGHHFTTPASA
uniref:SXP/RAL-2 family protein Ani s 5-like cation-binding domain-containing protein n=1 Tax=Panagrolaimus sp. ES5 TaxID=591445 RepID=A0AC34GPK7_9BILA